MGVFKEIVTKKKLIEQTKGELEVHPFYKRIDMPKPIFVKVDKLDSSGKVHWTNQYTNSTLDIEDFCLAHRHLEDDDSILEAELLFEGN